MPKLDSTRTENTQISVEKLNVFVQSLIGSGFIDYYKIERLQPKVRLYNNSQQLLLCLKLRYISDAKSKCYDKLALNVALHVSRQFVKTGIRS